MSDMGRVRKPRKRPICGAFGFSGLGFCCGLSLGFRVATGQGLQLTTEFFGLPMNGEAVFREVITSRDIGQRIHIRIDRLDGTKGFRDNEDAHIKFDFAIFLRLMNDALTNATLGDTPRLRVFVCLAFSAEDLDESFHFGFPFRLRNNNLHGATGPAGLQICQFG